MRKAAILALMLLATTLAFAAVHAAYAQTSTATMRIYLAWNPLYPEADEKFCMMLGFTLENMDNGTVHPGDGKVYPFKWNGTHCIYNATGLYQGARYMVRVYYVLDKSLYSEGTFPEDYVWMKPWYGEVPAPPSTQPELSGPYPENRTMPSKLLFFFYNTTLTSDGMEDGAIIWTPPPFMFRGANVYVAYMPDTFKLTGISPFNFSAIIGCRQEDCVSTVQIYGLLSPPVGILMNGTKALTGWTYNPAINVLFIAVNHSYSTNYELNLLGEEPPSRLQTTLLLEVIGDPAKPYSQVILKATLKDFYGNPISNQTIGFYEMLSGGKVVNLLGTAVTDESGVARLEVTFRSAGRREIIATWIGNEKYQGAVSNKVELVVPINPLILILAVAPLIVVLVLVVRRKAIASIAQSIRRRRLLRPVQDLMDAFAQTITAPEASRKKRRRRILRRG